MTLSSLFNSLDYLDASDEDEEDVFGVGALAAAANNQQQYERPWRKRSVSAHTSPDSKRTKTTQEEHAPPMLQPRYNGTGAPPSETVAAALNHETKGRAAVPVVLRSSSPNFENGDIQPIRSQRQPSGQNRGASSPTPRSSSPANSSPRDSPLSTSAVKGGNKVRSSQPSSTVYQTNNKSTSRHGMRKEALDCSREHKDQASVTDPAHIATCSELQLAKTAIVKPVSQSLVRHPARAARSKSKPKLATSITSNSFQRTNPVAPGNQDNHVAGASSVNPSTSTTNTPSFGEQITLVSRKSRHPAKSGKSTTRDTSDQCTTILDFASYLQTQSRDTEPDKSKQKPIFRDLIIYYAANGPEKRISHSTKRRMEILFGLGARIVGIFDSSITHIVSDLAEKPLVASLGVPSVKAIPPSIWVIGWNWVTKSMNSVRRLEETPYERFHKRLILENPLSDAKKDGYRSQSVETNEFTETGASSGVSSPEHSEAEGGGFPVPAPTSSGGLSIDAGPATHVELTADPLGSIVAQARNMTHADYSSERSISPEVPQMVGLTVQGTHVPATLEAQPRSHLHPHGKGFACLSRNTARTGECVNQALIDELARLRDIYEAKKHEDTSNQFRVMNYNRAIRSITNHTTKITSVDQAARLAGVGTNIAEKIHEFIFTGRVSKIAAQTTEDLAVTRLFQGIYGVGPQTAYSWYVRGLRTLADVRNRMGGIALSNSQVLGLEYYSDLQRRMPRSEAAEIFERIKAVALELDPKLDIEIMGSFRRGKATCGDIDILITRSTTDGGSHRGLLRKLLPILHGRKLVTHDLSSPDDDNELEAKYMGLCQLHSDTLMRRIDILTIPCDQWGAALLYFTGDDLFNRSMRLLARKKGMSLNQRGLFEGVIRDPKTQNKLSKGFLVASRTEREIFERLKVPWREPHERVINA